MTRSESPSTSPRASKIGDLLAGVRQRVYAREFRINPPVWSSDLLSVVEKLAQSVAQPVTEKPAHDDGAKPEPPDQKELMNFLADLGTGLWRLRQKMVQPGTDEPLEEMRRPYRHLASTWDVLAEEGIQILDHTDEVVPEGGIYALKAIAYQPMSHLTREQVIETIKPTIYYKEQMIQMGEVIIGTPEASAP
ncbi:MAG TPA: hypothetical protein VGB17_04740 [Pyrinomonadaceae bacterium]|jgi:hypothetical protein